MVEPVDLSGIAEMLAEEMRERAIEEAEIAVATAWLDIFGDSAGQALVDRHAADRDLRAARQIPEKG